MNLPKASPEPNLVVLARIWRNRIRVPRCKRPTPMRQAVARLAAALPAQRLAAHRRPECRHRVASLIFRRQDPLFLRAMARQIDGSRFRPHQPGANMSGHLLAIERGLRWRLGAHLRHLAVLARFPDTTRLLDAAEARVS